MDKQHFGAEILPKGGMILHLILKRQGQLPEKTDCAGEKSTA